MSWRGKELAVFSELLHPRTPVVCACVCAHVCVLGGGGAAFGSEMKNIWGANVSPDNSHLTFLPQEPSPTPSYGTGEAYLGCGCRRPLIYGQISVK